MMEKMLEIPKNVKLVFSGAQKSTYVQKGYLAITFYKSIKWVALWLYKFKTCLSWRELCWLET